MDTKQGKWGNTLGDSDIYILLCIKQITNKNLLYSMGRKGSGIKH